MRLRAARSARPRTRARTRTHAPMRADGIGRQLDPSINLLRTALPHLIRAAVGAALVPLLHPCRAGACARKCTPPAQARTLPATRGRHMLQQIATTAPSALSGAAARTGDNFVMGRGCSACRWDTSRQLKVKVRLACDVRYAACWAPGGAGLRSAQAKSRHARWQCHAPSPTRRGGVSGRPSRASAGLVPPACRAAPAAHDRGQPRAAAAPRWGQEEAH